MRTAIARTAAALALAALLCPALSAALAPGQKASAEGFLKQFAAPEFDTRQKAVEGLVALGPDAVPLVKETLAATDDNEVKLRCEMVLKALRAKFGAEAIDGPAAAPKTPAQPPFDASKVTLDLKEAPLSEALDALAQQSGNARIDARGFKDRPVTLKANDAPYWQTLDRALEQAEVVYVPPWYRGAEPAVLEAKAKQPSVAAYAGPAVFWVDRVVRTTTSHKTLNLRTDLSGARTPVSRSISIAARVFAEDRLNAATPSVRYTKAVDADGKDILPKYLAGTPLAGNSQQIGITDTEEGIKGPLTLEGIVRLSFYGGAIERRADDVFADKRTAGDEEILLRDVFAVRKDRTIQVGLTLTGDASRVGLVTYDMPRGYGFVLVDPAGKHYMNIISWGHVGSAFNLAFHDVPDIAGKWSLLLVIPKSIETKEFPFVLKDVPLP